MALSPLDIESRQFRRQLFGYRRADVDELLRNAADAWSQVALEREDLGRMVQAAKGELENYRGREKTLIDALAGAERLAEEKRQLAHQEAERIIADARRHAEQIISRTRSEVTNVEQQMMRLKIERETFENRLAALIDEHKRLLEIRRQEAGLAERLRGRTTLPPAVPENE